MLHLFAWAKRAYTNLKYPLTCNFDLHEIQRLGFAGYVSDEFWPRQWLLDNYISAAQNSHCSDIEKILSFLYAV